MTKSLEWVRNTKTGNQGIVVERYVHTGNGRAMIQVNVGVRTAYWLASACEAA